MSEKLLLLILNSLLDGGCEVVFQFSKADDLMIDASDHTFVIGDYYVSRGEAFEYLSENYDQLVDICQM